MSSFGVVSISSLSGLNEAVTSICAFVEERMPFSRFKSSFQSQDFISWTFTHLLAKVD